MNQFELLRVNERNGSKYALSECQERLVSIETHLGLKSPEQLEEEANFREGEPKEERFNDIQEVNDTEERGGA